MSPEQFQAIQQDVLFQFFLARMLGVRGDAPHPVTKVQVVAYLWRDEIYFTNIRVR